MTLRSRLLALSAAAAMLAGCQGATIDDLTPKADRDLPPVVLAKMKSMGMSRSSPIMMRIFKDDSTLEIWKAKDDGRYALIGSYKICRWSGKLGPKKVEGDRQAPEGFYYIHRWQMNPNSHYYLSFNIGYPNEYDRAWGRTGTNLMIHGACSSAGCYSMSDQNVAQIYAFARDALAGGQDAFLIEAFPFRMTPENMAKHRDDPNYPFWQMLRQGYEDFEITHVPPKVDVCDRKYVVDVAFDGNAKPSPTASCPPSTTPASLLQARADYDAQYQKAFDKEVALLAREQPSTIAAATPATSAALAVNTGRSSSTTSSGTPVPQSNPAEAPVPTASANPEKKHWWSAFVGGSEGNAAAR